MEHRSALEGSGQIFEHVFILASDFDVGIFFATHNSVPDYDIILYLCLKLEGRLEDVKT